MNDSGRQLISPVPLFLIFQGSTFEFRSNRSRWSPLPTILLPRRSVPYPGLPVASSEHLCHVFHLLPDIEAHEDRSGFLSRHGSTIARPPSISMIFFCRFRSPRSRQVSQNRCRPSAR